LLGSETAAVPLMLPSDLKIQKKMQKKLFFQWFLTETVLDYPIILKKLKKRGGKCR